MKKKFYLFAATAAMLLAACSGDDATGVTENGKDAPQAIAFDTYTAGSTRAGQTHVMTTSTLKTSGFGVFATYTDNAGYSSTTATPNFMYNQEVANVSSAWTYSPLKYWPNETTKDSQTSAATMSDLDRLSFFAYAPYVNNEANAPSVKVSGNEVGITALSGKSATGDPTITYKVSTDPSKSIDLLWGVAPSGDLSYDAVNGSNIKVTAGLPLLNLVKPDKDQKIKFLFKHALSRIGLSIVGSFDQMAAGGEQDSKTKVLVEKIEIFGKGNIGTEGVLNLNNTTANVANWTSITRWNSDDALFTITNELNLTILDKGAVAFANQMEGVTASEKNVFQDETKYFMVVPTGDTNITVKITYYTQTKDDNLAVSGLVDGSRIKNVITKTVPVDLKNNKSYNLKLTLGLTSVKIDAEVADWEVDGDTEVFLPQNVE